MDEIKKKCQVSVATTTTTTKLSKKSIKQKKRRKPHTSACADVSSLANDTLSSMDVKR